MDISWASRQALTEQLWTAAFRVVLKAISRDMKYPWHILLPTKMKKNLSSCCHQLGTEWAVTSKNEKLCVSFRALLWFQMFPFFFFYFILLRCRCHFQATIHSLSLWPWMHEPFMKSKETDQLKKAYHVKNNLTMISINKTDMSVISEPTSDISGSCNWFVLPHSSQRSICHQVTCNGPFTFQCLSGRVYLPVCVYVSVFTIHIIMMHMFTCMWQRVFAHTRIVSVDPELCCWFDRSIAP